MLKSWWGREQAVEFECLSGISPVAAEVILDVTWSQGRRTNTIRHYGVLL